MTIYQDSKRIVKLSTDKVETVTEETLDSTNGTASWNADNGGSGITIDTTNNEIDMACTQGSASTTQKSAYFDLGASVSASAWVLRFKISSSGSPTGNPLFWVGMFDVNTIDSRNTNVDGISLMMYTGSNYLLSMKNGTHMDSGGSQTLTSPTVSADTTTRYVEIVRDGSNAILTFYDSDTYTTSIGTCTVAITGSSFQYLCALNYFEGSGRTYSLSNVKFYNGVSSLSSKPTDVQNNSILVEKDTGRRYWFNLKHYTPDMTSNTNWLDNVTARIDNNTSTGKIDFDVHRTDTNQSLSYDLGTPLSDTAWTLKYKMTVNTITATSSDNKMFMGMRSVSSSSNAGVTSDFIGWRSQIGSGVQEFRYESVNDGSIDGGDALSSVTPAETTYYITLSRKTPSTFSLRISTSSDYTGGTLHDDISCSDGITGLQYLWIGNVAVAGGSGARFIGTIEDIEIYDSATWTMNPTYESDFTTSAGWVSNASNVVVNTSTKKLTFAWTAATPNQQIYYDLGTVSDTKFVLRFVVNYSTLTNAGAHLPVADIKLSGSNSSANYPLAASQISFQLSAGSGSANVYFKSTNTSGGGEVSPTAVAWNPTTGTDYYVEMIRTSATHATLNVRTGSHSGTMVTNFPMNLTTINSGCTGLRYIRLQQYPNSFGNITGTLDDVEFYNGVTTPN